MLLHRLETWNSAATSALVIKNDGFGEDSGLGLPNRSVSADRAMLRSTPRRRTTSALGFHDRVCTMLQERKTVNSNKLVAIASGWRPCDMSST